MRNAKPWQQSLEGFFSGRARHLGANPSLADLCYVSGRDPRVWADRADYDDLIDSIVDQLELTDDCKILEVGCASGFIAYGLAGKVSKYVGVDLAKPALSVARRLPLANAEFTEADGAKLPFPDNSFDAVLCYDVFTNFPDWAIGESVVNEMLRVLRPGKRALVGSIPDVEVKAEFEEKVREVGAHLFEKYGEMPVRPVHQSFWQNLAQKYFGRPPPGICCYYFSRIQFAEYANRRGVQLSFRDVHQRNPYRGLRFNALFAKAKA